MKALLIPAVLVPLTVSGSSRAATHSPQPTGLYSTMTISARTGDASGFEIFLLPGLDSMYVLFQIAEGAPSDPVLVRAAVADGAISFDLSPTIQQSLGRFTGTVSRAMLTGRFQDGTQITLPRRNSIWQR